VNHTCYLQVANSVEHWRSTVYHSVLYELGECFGKTLTGALVKTETRHCNENTIFLHKFALQTVPVVLLLKYQLQTSFNY